MKNIAKVLIIAIAFGTLSLTSASANTDREAAKAAYRQSVEAFKAEMVVYKAARDQAKSQIDAARVIWDAVKAANPTKEAKKLGKQAFEQARLDATASIPAKPTRPVKPVKQ
jgi:hypothetical protein